MDATVAIVAVVVIQSVIIGVAVANKDRLPAELIVFGAPIAAILIVWVASLLLA
jgi:hypothetical protein